VHRLNLTVRVLFACLFLFCFLFSLLCFVFVFFVAIVFSLEYTHHVRGVILFDAKANTLLEFLFARKLKDIVRISNIAHDYP